MDRTALGAGDGRRAARGVRARREDAAVIVVEPATPVIAIGDLAPTAIEPAESVVAADDMVAAAIELGMFVLAGGDIVLAVAAPTAHASALDRFAPTPTGRSSPRITAVRIPELERSRRCAAASAAVRSIGSDGGADGAGIDPPPVAPCGSPMAQIYAG